VNVSSFDMTSEKISRSGAKIFIIGISGPVLTSEQEKLVLSCKFIVGGQRLLALIAGFNIPAMDISPLKKVLPAIEEALGRGNVAVLASGDPLFFGIGRRLLADFGKDAVEIYPELSSMQGAMARFKVPWDDARLLSLHGREHNHVAGLLLAQSKTFVFTDKKNSPDFLARQLVSYLQCIEAYDLLDGCQVMVAENLGSEEETLFRGTLQETVDRDFADLNVFLLVAPISKKTGRLGLQENDLAHSRGLITKNEVRAVTLHSLCLPGEGAFWDVGAGSGSISIEAARMNPHLTIYAIERKVEELINIKENIRRYCCYNVIPVAGLALDMLAELPDPQRVFIGGNAGQLAGIIAEAAKRLPGDGILVANAVIRKTQIEVPQLMAKAGFSPRVSSINVTRTETNGEFVEFNQIHIITGSR